MVGYGPAVALTLLSSSLFGLMGLFNTIAAEGGLGLYERITLRFLLAAIVLWIIRKVQKKPTGLSKSLRLRFFLSSALYFGGTSFLLFLSYTYIPTSLTTTLHFIYPVLVLLLSMSLDNYRPSKAQIGGTILSLSGLLFALRPSVVTGPGATLGIGLAIASALSFALYVRFLGQKEVQHMETTHLMLHVCISAALAWSLPALFTLATTEHQPVIWSKALGGVLALALLSTVLGCTFFTLGVRVIGGEKASMLSVFEPITATLVGVVLLSESLSSTFALGSALILAGSLLICKPDTASLPYRKEIQI